MMAGAALAVLAGGALEAQPGRGITNPPQPATVPAHLAKAKQLAGEDPFPRWVASNGYWCMPPAEGNAAAFAHAQDADGVEPVQVFDNLYYVGKVFVGVFILKTSDGLVLWDALDYYSELDSILLPGMKKLGLDPKDIKLVIITHGHFDHFGAARLLQERYGATVAASAADWQLMADYKSDGSDRRPAPPVKQRVLSDGEVVHVGDADIRIVITPGHTPGTVSSILPVKDRGVTRMVAMWGGTAYPAGAALEAMGRSMDKLRAAAAAANAEGIIDDHAEFLQMRQNLAARAPGAPNPLIIGKDAVQRTFDVMGECLANMKDWRAAMAPR
jgi:metallo-beta-lactamase class B